METAANVLTVKGFRTFVFHALFSLFHFPSSFFNVPSIASTQFPGCIFVTIGHACRTCDSAGEYACCGDRVTITSPWLIFLNPSVLTLNCHWFTKPACEMKSRIDACLPESADAPKYVSEQAIMFYQPVTVCYHESREAKISVVYHCCPTSWLLAALTRNCLIDKFLEGQRAYYSTCQIPSRRWESVHYSITVKWWLNLAVVFWTRFPPVVMRSQYLTTNKHEEIRPRECHEALRKQKMWRHPPNDVKVDAQSFKFTSYPA